MRTALARGLDGSECPAFLLYDDSTARAFEPFATSRPLCEMRVGVSLVRERWESVVGGASTGFVSSPHLEHFAEFDAPRAANVDVPAGALLVNARAIPFAQDIVHASKDTAAGTWTVAGRVAAVRTQAPLSAAQRAALRDGTLALDTLAHAASTRALDGVWLDEVWDIVGHLNALLLTDIPALARTLSARALTTSGGAAVIGPHVVSLEAGATVEPHVVFDTTLGPVLLRRGATVQAFTRVVGPCYVGIDSTIMADRISGSAIGDVCRVHGELSSCVFIGHANKGHDGFVGHSIVGRWVNMGAGTITSNLKNTYGTVALWTPSGIRNTGLQFLGTLFGDHAKTGIGLTLTTGCVLGTAANVMEAMPPKYVAPFSWGTRAPYERFTFDKFVQTASRMMSRRGVTLDDAQRDFWHALHARAGVVASANPVTDDAARHGSR